MKNKCLLCALAVALGVGGFAVNRAFAAEKSAPEMRGRILQRIAQRLELTDDQKSQIKNTLSGEKDALKPLMMALHEARTNLRESIRAKDANESAVRAASAKVASAEADLAVERMKIFAKLSPILTEEQRAKISEMESRMDDFADMVIARVGNGLAD